MSCDHLIKQQGSKLFEDNDFVLNLFSSLVIALYRSISNLNMLLDNERW